MTILSRMFRLCKADVHGVMDQLEDKNLLLKQYLREMEESLKSKEDRLAQMQRSYQHVQRDLAGRNDEVKKLESDLDLAVRKEKDDIARMLIRKRRSLQAGCEQLALQLDQLNEEKESLSEILARQKLQFDQCKIKAAAFCGPSGQHLFEEAEGIVSGTGSTWKTPTDEEIELELIQRKEALEKGGAA